MKKLVMLIIMALLVCSFVSATPFLNTAKATGISLQNDNGVLIWTGKYGGNMKPKGPLVGKTIGILVGCEFSDWQAYYLSEFIGEFGGLAQFIMDNNHLWKETRPSRESPIPHGQWGLSLTDGMDGLGMNGCGKVKYPVVLQKAADPKLKVANPADYDALIIIGGHSGDILVADDVATNFVKAVAARNVPMAGIGAGLMPLIHLGLLNGKKATGNNSVDYMVKAVARWSEDRVVVDGKFITAQDTIDTPKLLRELCKQFDKSFKDPREGILKGKRVLMMVTETGKTSNCAPRAWSCSIAAPPTWSACSTPRSGPNRPCRPPT